MDDDKNKDVDLNNPAPPADPPAPPAPPVPPVDDKDKDNKDDTPDFNDPFKNNVEDKDKNKDDDKDDDKDKKDKKDDDDGEIDDDDDKMISKHVDRKLQPYLSKLQAQERTGEIDSFMTSELGTQFKNYEAKIKEIAMSPRGKDLTIKAIAFAVAGNDLLKIGAKMGKKKDEEAAAADDSGGSHRPKDGDGAFPDTTNMPKAEFNMLIEQVKQGKYTKK